MTDKVYTCIGARNFAKTDRHKEDFSDASGQRFSAFCRIFAIKQWRRPVAPRRNAQASWHFMDASCTVFGPEEMNRTSAGKRQDTAVHIPAQQTDSSPPS